MAEADPNHVQFNTVSHSAVVPIDLPRSQLESMQLLRADFLDQFAVLETRLADLAARYGIAPKLNVAMGLRLEEFLKADVSAAERKSIAKLKDKISGVNEVRSHIVHSQLSVVIDSTDGALMLIFKHVPIHQFLATVLPEEKFRHLIAQTKQACATMTQIIDRPAIGSD